MTLWVRFEHAGAEGFGTLEDETVRIHAGAMFDAPAPTGQVLALALGWHLVASIGGGDMPVVVSMLNSYSGWAAAASGFLLGNDLLIITGALVGSSGAYLSYIMCKAMNRSFISVIAGGFGNEGSAASSDVDYGEHTEISAEETAELLREASSVVITPGYGMAVAQAQHHVRELTELVEKRGGEVKFAVHPVAGRMPGHLNVILSEAGIDYDRLLTDVDDANAVLQRADVAMVIGANDIVNNMATATSVRAATAATCRYSQASGPPGPSIRTAPSSWPPETIGTSATTSDGRSGLPPARRLAT